MSMPQIPDIQPHIDLRREDVVTLLLASVALEEMSLSHILNAEGEKLQAVLAAAAKSCHPDLALIRDVNESAERTVSGITRVQMLLQMKMENILRFAERPRPAPCPGHPRTEDAKKSPSAAAEKSPEAGDGQENCPFRLRGVGEGCRDAAGPENGPVRLKAHIGPGKRGPHRYLKYYTGGPEAEGMELTLLPSDFRPEAGNQELRIRGRGILGGAVPKPGTPTEFFLRITGRGRDLSLRMQFPVPGRPEPYDSGEIHIVSGDLELS